MTDARDRSGPHLPEYRVYVLDEFDRVFHPAQYLEALNDHLAIEMATRLLDRRPIEVWRGVRLIARLKPDKARPDGPLE